MTDEQMLSSPVAHLRRQNPIYKAIARAEAFLHKLMESGEHVQEATEIHSDLHDASYLFVIQGQVDPKAMSRAEIVERLRQSAQSVSRASKIMAEHKSLRQGDCDPPRADLYEWTKPEKTFEWQVADTLESLYERDALFVELIESIIADMKHSTGGGMSWISHDEAEGFEQRLQKIVEELKPADSSVPVTDPAL